jgi:hypothetical protein
MRSWWAGYRCLNFLSSNLRIDISLFERNAGYCAEPMYDGFMALEMALKTTGYEEVRSVWVPRNCPTGIAGADCEKDGDGCTLHNYGVAVDIDPFGYGNPHFLKPFNDDWDFSDCKITRAQVLAVESIKNTQGEQFFRWLGWAIGDTMHFEGQVRPTRCEVDWETVAGYQGDDMPLNAEDLDAIKGVIEHVLGGERIKMPKLPTAPGEPVEGDRYGNRGIINSVYHPISKGRKMLTTFNETHTTSAQAAVRSGKVLTEGAMVDVGELVTALTPEIRKIVNEELRAVTYKGE